jgi:hypothetical protein
MAQLLRFRCRWNDSIKIHVKEIVCEVVYWIQLAQNKAQ